ncbi:unnamed protein product [Caenorhabditis angaria]|uniref:Uncharacterized protein n=1 Tax=Caenorhabditis angaria TaxID=860376 RepID=A0A9P1IER4_9PELO|nr:unnamed protein product [Caenorhabditis angaria]
MVEEGMESPLGNGTQSGEFEFETKVKDPEVMPSRKTKTKTTKKPIETTTTQSSTTEIPEENTIEESTVADDNSTENATSEEIDSLLLEESENVETEKETSIEVYDDDIWDYNDMNKRFKNKPVKYQNLHGITNEQLRSVVMVTKRRKREVSSSEDSNQSDIGEDEDGDAWKTLKTITTANGDTTITVVEEINHIHGANGSSAKSWIKIDATDIIRPTLLLYSPEAIHALGLKISPKFFKRYENVGLYLSTICSEFVPKAVAAFDGKDFKSSGNEYNIGLNVTELELDGVNMTELAEKLRNDTEVDEILLRINGSTKNVGGSYVIPVLDKFKYDPSTAPIVFQGSAVDVRFGIYIESMSNFQTSTMDYDMDIYLMMAWRDVRLRHTYGGTILLKEEELLEKIWRPDPFFANAKEAEFHEVTFLNFLMRIFNDGLILYETRVKIKPSCNLILCKYPHDKQTCDLLIKSFAYPIETVRFEWFSRRDYAIDKNPDVKLPELYIDRYETQNCPNNRKSGAFSCLRAVFRLKRDVGFHIAQTYIPTSLALMFSWVGVWLPEEFMEGRIGVAITVLLTLSTESAGAREHLPSVSYLKAIDLWFGFITGFVFFTLLQTLFVIGFDKRSAQLRKWAGKKGVEMNEETREALLQKATKYHKTGRYLDNFCRVFYPLSFILFLFMYYFVFTEGSQEDCMKR